jgi:outer membrane protein assembly factor BamB
VKHIGFVIAAVILVSGCGGASNLQPPNALTPLDKPLRVETLWNRQAGNGVGDQYLKLPVQNHGDIGYVADYKGYVKAFNIKNGDLRWEKQTGLELATPAVYDDGRLLFGTRQGEVVALSASDGDLVWRSRVSSEVIAKPAVAQGIVVVRSNDGKLYALDSDSGARRWVYDRSVPPLTLRGNSAPIINSGLVITGSDNGRLTALVLKNGSVFWETPIAVPSGRTELERIIDIDADPVVVGDVVYAVSYQGRLAAVNMASGRLLWARDMSSYTDFAVDAYRIYLTDADGQVWALNRRNGATLWRQDKLLRRSVTGPVLYGSHVVVADFDGFVHWLSREDGKLESRARINAAYYLFNEDYDKYDPVFRKENNVLAMPLSAQNEVIVIDRRGNMAAFQLPENN